MHDINPILEEPVRFIGTLPAEVAHQQKRPLLSEFYVKNIVRMVFGGKKNI